MDEGDSKRKIQKASKQGAQVNAIQRYISNVSDVLSTVWVRCPIQTDNGPKRVLLDCRRSLLLNFRLFLVIVYLTYEAFK